MRRPKVKQLTPEESMRFLNSIPNPRDRYALLLREARKHNPENVPFLVERLRLARERARRQAMH